MVDRLFDLDSDGCYFKNNTADFTIMFDGSSYDLRGIQHEAALIQLTMTNSYYNISAAQGNNLFVYYNGTAWKTIVLPDGNYNIQYLVQELQYAMVANGDTTVDTTTGLTLYPINFVPHYPYSMLTISLNAGYQVDFTQGTLNQLLGFNSAILTTSITGPNKTNMNGPIDQLMIHCSLIGGEMSLNKYPSDVLYSFVPNAAPMGVIAIERSHPFYIPLSRRDLLSQIRIYITDQNNGTVNLNCYGLNVIIHVRPVQRLLVKEK